jgi:hypothetical protein
VFQCDAALGKPPSTPFHTPFHTPADSLRLVFTPRRAQVFQCDTTLGEGALAAVVAHEMFDEASDARAPRTWVFCPDPLCLDARPSGSRLPAWCESNSTEYNLRI